MMRSERAAAYLGMSTSQFLKMVNDGELPKPVRWPHHEGMVVWDRLDLDAAVDNLHHKQSRKRNTVHMALGIADDDD
jgi:predicted DNA-binding transcriptional regulator AlpA